VASTVYRFLAYATICESVQPYATAQTVFVTCGSTVAHYGTVATVLRKRQALATVKTTNCGAFWCGCAHSRRKTTPKRKTFATKAKQCASAKQRYLIQ